MRLRRYVNGWKDIDLAPDTADIDGDGEITAGDARMVLHAMSTAGKNTKHISKRLHNKKIPANPFTDSTD